MGLNKCKKIVIFNVGLKFIEKFCKRQKHKHIDVGFSFIFELRIAKKKVRHFYCYMQVIRIVLLYSTHLEHFYTILFEKIGQRQKYSLYL